MKRQRKYQHDLGTVIYNLRMRFHCKIGCCRGYTLSQSHVAKSIGVSLHTIHRIEADGTQPNKVQYQKILKWINQCNNRLRNQ